MDDWFSTQITQMIMIFADFILSAQIKKNQRHLRAEEKGVIL